MIYLSSNLFRSINTKRKQKRSQILPPPSLSTLLFPLIVSFVKIILIPKNIFIFNHSEFEFIITENLKLIG